MSTASSDVQSPQAAAARSSRVCLNCRRKKKRCDKSLPTCGRCTYSLEVCQHENELDYLRPANHMLGLQQSSQARPAVAVPVFEHHLFSAQHPEGSRWAALTPAVFASMDICEDTHTFVWRSVEDVFGHPSRIEQVVSHYFNSINPWFTVLERTSFEQQLGHLRATPSAETALVILCMFLVVQAPSASGGTPLMADSLYATAKSLVGLVQSRAALSVSVLQANLLVGLYEFGQGLSQQAYMTVGGCCQIGRAFGWLRRSFWAEDRMTGLARELKQCSVLWWAVVYMDSLVHVAYPDQLYPLSTADTTPDFSIPFPEAFDQYLGFQSQHARGSAAFLDADMDHIEGIVWPESSSAYYLRSVLQSLSLPNPISTAERNHVSGLITTHTLNVLAGNWRTGNRYAAVGSNLMYMFFPEVLRLARTMSLTFAGRCSSLLKVNQPHLLVNPAALPSLTSEEIRPIETVRSVITSVFNASQAMNASSGHVLNGNVAPCGAFGGYYAALLLILHGDGVLHDPQWLEKVEVIKISLELFRKRWAIADRYVVWINMALSHRLDTFTER